MTSHTLLLLLVALSCTIAQDLGAQGRGHREWLIYVSPSKAIPLLKGVDASGGIELIVKDKWSFSVEAGYQLAADPAYQSDSIFIDSEGFSFGTELKFYENNLMDGKLANDYVSIEYRYISRMLNDSYCYYLKDDFPTGGSLTDHYGVRKDAHVLTVKYGLLLTFGRHLYFDPYAGIGVRLVDNTNIGRIDFDPITMSYCDPTGPLSGEHFSENSGIRPSFSLGFKFGLRL